MGERPASLPPRHALPDGVQVPVLPGLGVSWYDRRNGYWGRPPLVRPRPSLGGCPARLAEVKG